MLWCSVSCVPLCKGVRCDRLCTLFIGCYPIYISYKFEHLSQSLDLFKVYHVTCLLSSIVLGLLAKNFKVLLLPNYSLDLIQVY